MKRRIITMLLCACLLIVPLAYGEGLLPTLTNTYGVAMPSLTEALGRYPGAEETVDGAAVERWTNITEEDFNAFGVYLKKCGAVLQDYQVEGSVFTATVAKDGRTFGFVFDTETKTAVVTYPAGTYDERLFSVRSIWNAAEAAENAGQYAEAAEKYASLIRYEGAKECYRDSGERELRCWYEEGEAKRAAQDCDGAVSAFTRAGTYSDAATQVKETRYQQAGAFMDKGDYDGAYSIFSGIRGYKDVDSLLVNDHNLSAAAAAAAAAAARDAKYSVGNYVTFGHYPQRSGGNDSTEIEWLVVARDGNKALLLSRYGLDAQPYNTEREDITWEKCTLRTWLNGTFLNKAFTAEEQEGILLTNVDNGSSQGYWDTNGGNNTQDRVFLLSYAEANTYLGVTREDSNNMKSRAAPTAYALKQGASTSSSYKTADGSAAGWWWLRSPGNYQSDAAYVSTDGSLSRNFVDTVYACVRPALWINLESDIF